MLRPDPKDPKYADRPNLFVKDMLLWDSFIRPPWEGSKNEMEKHGEIKQGVTPPEQDGEKHASEDQLEDHVSKRAADAAQDAMSSKSPPASSK